MASEVIEGNERDTYVALERIPVTYHGITYQPRGSR